MSWGGRFNFRQGGPIVSGLRPLGRCSAPKPAVVVIDEDDDGDGGSDSDVFIVDIAAGKAFPTKSRSQTKKGEGSSGNVINLDDDEDEEVEEVTGEDKAGPSTTPGATTPGRASARNRYGLGGTSDSSESDLSEGLDSYSDSDSESESNGTSDCEIMDDTRGTARKLWESAASRKKMPDGVHKRKDSGATASTSSSGLEAQPDENAEGLFGAECQLGDDIFRFFRDEWKQCAQDSTGCTKDGRAECNLNGNMHFGDAWKGEQSSTCGGNDGQSPSSVSNAKECSNGNVSNGKETGCSANFTLDPETACNDKMSHSRNDSVPEKAPEGSQSPQLHETIVDSFVSAKRVFPTSSSEDWKDGSPPISVSTPDKIDEKIPEGACSQKDQSPSDPHHIFNKDTHSAKDDGPVSGQRVEVPSFTIRYNCSTQFGENRLQVQDNSHACAAASIRNSSVNITSGSCSFPQEALVDDPKELGNFTLAQGESDIQDGLIGEREKHKESAEYKRAAEEEWASRQRQLQIQAEEAKEAKRLKKRKKAEALRLLDMEKRQKQRLQEVRESQKKNEEEIQLKEQYRGIVRKQLEDTERTYGDIASILRVLGIPVEGSEVKVALKQAQVKFHPDRVSRTDIYQQVKAEETFKFISRLKEKLPRFP